MGAYISQSNLVPAVLSQSDLVRLTQDTSSSTAVDTDTLAAVILQAEAEVDGYLGARHQLPLATVPPLVMTLTCRIARYHLHARRPNMLTDDIKSDYSRAVAVLEKVATGHISLGVTPEPEAATERVIRVTGQDRVFSRTKMSGF